MSAFIGHFHVVLVHLPIGILLLACLFMWLERRPEYAILHKATGIALFTGMIAAIFSAITGYCLSLTGDYEEQLVRSHQWFGISVAVVSILMFYLHKSERSGRLQISSSFLLFALIIVTGHLGGSLTHGSDYLTKATSGNSDSSTVQQKIIPNIQEAVVYSDIIQPVLQAKCYGCHGRNKQKGKLRMDDSTRLMKGGKDGPVILPGNAAKSELVRRISLAREDDDHMPPKEKSQLTEQEIALIHWWIVTGASFNKKVKQLDQPENLKTALLALQNRPVQKLAIPDIPSSPVVPGNSEAIGKLRSIGAIVEPVAQNTNYLSINFVMAMNAGDSGLQSLTSLTDQVIELKLSNTTITDSALQVVARLKNLMRLQLDHTRVTDKGLEQLKSLQNLRYLNLVGTSVTTQGVMSLKGLKNLQSIYLYQTSVKKAGWSELKKAFPKTLIDSGGYQVPLFTTDTIVVKPPPTKKE